MAKGKGGRPKIEFDLDEVFELAKIQCTNGEIAAVLGVSRDTIQRRLRDDEKFSDTVERGREVGKQSLRRLQWEKAKSGNTTMLIWLGKQELGQSDKARTEISGPDGGPIHGVLVVPSALEESDWEAVAKKQQEALSAGSPSAEDD